MPAIVNRVDDAASQLSLLGARIEEVELPDAKLFEACGGVIVHAESFALHREQLARSGDLYSEKTFPYFMAGIALDESDLGSSAESGQSLWPPNSTPLSFRGSTLCLTVTTCTTALPFSDFQGAAARWTPMRTMAFNVTGHPALSVPCGFIDGLPVGMQIVGQSRRRGDDLPDRPWFRAEHGYWIGQAGLAVRCFPSGSAGYATFCCSRSSRSCAARRWPSSLSLALWRAAGGATASTPRSSSHWWVAIFT